MRPPFLTVAVAAMFLFAAVNASNAEPGASAPWHLLTLDDVDAGHYVHHGYTSIAIDASGKIHISYRGPVRVLRYTTNGTGAWRAESVFVDPNRVSVARENSLALDSSGRPHISFSYSDGNAEDLKYARKRADGTWEVVTVFVPNSPGMENDIALDHNDTAHISHWEWWDDKILYSTNASGTWTTTPRDDANWDRTALAVDSNDQVHLVYKSGAQLKHQHEGTTQTIDSNAAGTSGPALAVDPLNRLHVSYASGANLKYATNATGTWQITTIASGVNAGRHHSIAVDQQGNAHISYLDQSSGTLFYATNASGSWSHVAVDSGPALGYSNSIAVGEDGRAAISFRYQTGITYSFQDIWGSSPSDVFFVGREGGILHYDGTSLIPMVSGTAYDLLSVWGSSPSDVFAAGMLGRIVHYNGSQWTNHSSGTSSYLYGIWGSSASSVFAVGTSGVVLHYDGASWSPVTFPAQTSLYAIWGSSDDDLFVAGASGSIFHYDGTAWTSMPSGTAQNLWALWGSSPSDLFAVGEFGTILHYDGVQWTKMGSGTTKTLYGVWADAAGAVFAVGSSGVILRFDGASWTAMAPPTGETLAAVWGEPSGDVFAAGYHQIFRSDRTSWKELTAAKLRIASNCILAPNGECLPPPGPASDFWTVAPCRVLDTRDPAGPLGGLPLGSGMEQPFALAGRCGIPASSTAVSLNITVVQPSGGGYLQIHPSDTGSFGTSTLNFRAGQVTANNALLRVSADGEAAITFHPYVLDNGSVHVVLDVNGYFEPGQD